MLALLLAPQAQAPQEPPKGLDAESRPARRRPDDAVPLLDFDKYFLGTWTFEADAPDSVLGPGGVSSGTVTYRKLADGFYEAVTEGKARPAPSRSSNRSPTTAISRWRSATSPTAAATTYMQMAEVGGNIGGDYRLFFKSAPFTYKGKQVRLNHTVYLAAPLTFRVDIEVAEGTGPFVHMSPWRFRRHAVATACCRRSRGNLAGCMKPLPQVASRSFVGAAAITCCTVWPLFFNFAMRSRTVTSTSR